MRKFMPLSFLLLFALGGLSACGGSSGGGGGGGAPIFASSIDDVSNYMPTNDSQGIYRDGEEIVLLPGGDLELRLAPGDFRLEGDFWKAEKDAPAHPIFGNKASSHKLYMGGKKLELEHSDFGLWLAYTAPQPLAAALEIATLTDGGMRADLPAGGQLTFKGKTIAFMTDDIINEAVLTGDATFQVTGTNYSLTLDFANFYSFQIDMEKDSGMGSFKGIAGSGQIVAGSISRPDLAWAKQDGKGVEHSWATAQFLGANQASASEGVGKYNIKYTNESSQDIYLGGAFGVKIELPPTPISEPAP